jgi:hypothetical protein
MQIDSATICLPVFRTSRIRPCLKSSSTFRRACAIAHLFNGRGGPSDEVPSLLVLSRRPGVVARVCRACGTGVNLALITSRGTRNPTTPLVARLPPVIFWSAGNRRRKLPTLRQD